MHQSTTKEIGGQKLTINELTVAQVKKVMEDLESGKHEFGVLDLLLEGATDGGSFPANALLMAVDMEAEELLEMIGPSYMKELYETVVDINPTSAAMMERLQKVGKAKLQQSEEQPAA